MLLIQSYSGILAIRLCVWGGGRRERGRGGGWRRGASMERARSEHVHHQQARARGGKGEACMERARSKHVQQQVVRSHIAPVHSNIALVRSNIAQ